MQSSWSNSEARRFGRDALGKRVYTSRLLGREPSLVLHGGGNTSVKVTEKNKFGDTEELLYVKGSGWDLATIERAGFAPVRMAALLKMAKLSRLGDEEMVQLQRAAMTNPYAPNPSVEAILHAILPFKFVDHTHADAVVTITNSPNGRKRIEEIYGSKVLVIPYVMPGFILARDIYLRTKNIDWNKYEGMILLNHGVFTFNNDARAAYEKMIQLVSKAERYLNKKAKLPKRQVKPQAVDLVELARLRRAVSAARGKAVLAQLDQSPAAVAFSRRKNLKSITGRGPVTPDHIIRTKRVPLIYLGRPKRDTANYVHSYQTYFKKYKTKGLTCLDPAPRVGIWPGVGTVAFGTSLKENAIITDITQTTTNAIARAEKLGGWRALPQKDLFEMEYWVLEQAKLKKGGSAPVFQGKVALVTGAASGIGKACVAQLVQAGAVVAALDISPKITSLFGANVLGIQTDVTRKKDLQKALETTVRRFGGLDILIPNAGIFPPSENLESLKDATWEKSVALNLTSQQQLISLAVPYLKEGVDPAIVIIASKNVPAPGPGAAAYSVPKAGLTQLGRVAALELAKYGVRVNMLHPNAVFDTAIWTKDVLAKRAKSYGLSVAEYKRHNLLKTEITSADVAALAVTLAGPAFAKTTGAQIPVDGGNDRVI